MFTFVKHAHIFLLLAVAFVSVACDDQKLGERFPVLEVSPDPIEMPAADRMNAAVKTVTVRNAGGSELVITAIDFSNGIDTREFTKEHPALPMRLGSEEETTLLLKYLPINVGQDQGELLITSNDAGGLRRVPINTNEADSELLYEDRLELFSEDGMSPVVEAAIIQNIGTVGVTVTSFSIGDDPDGLFTLLTNSAETSLQRGDELSIQVQYQPNGDEIPDEATLNVVTSSETYGTFPIRLVGTVPSPEIAVIPDRIDFGATDRDVETMRQRLIVTNEGTAPLTITDINFTTVIPDLTVNDYFLLHALPELPVVIEVDNQIEFEVSYLPTVEGRHTTQLVLTNDDLDEGSLAVPLSGRVRQPCIQVIPENIEFGAVARGEESAHVPVQVVNCGDLPLVVENLELNGEGFSWEPADGGDRENIELEPLSAWNISVWYTNNSLPEGESVEGALFIRNNSPDNAELQVPLSVTGGGAASCNLRILPARVNFGMVARGRNATRSLEVLNTGTGRCEIRGQRIAPPMFDLNALLCAGVGGRRFYLTQPVAEDRRTVRARERAPIEVTYRPQVFCNDTAQLEVTYYDPYMMQERTAVANLSGVGGESNIQVIPGRLDFGLVTAGLCASREERISVYNTGRISLCVTNVELQGDGCGEFLIVDRPVANADGCIEVRRGTPADVRVVYEPLELGQATCDLVFLSDASNDAELRVPLQGEGTGETRGRDEFVQESGQKVDVLFVIDNSGSMGEEQSNLSSNFAQFISGAAQFSNDYQLGVITTDMQTDDDNGKLKGSPRIITRSPTVESQFQSSIEVGTGGSGTEQGLAAAQAALSDPLIADTGIACSSDMDCIEPDRCVEGSCGGANRGFLRQSAALEVVFVSDEDDQSQGTLDFYVDFLKSLKGFRNESRMHAHAIVGAQNGRATACSSSDGDASAGERYVDVATRTNGGVYSICNGDFGAPLQEIGNRAFGLPVQFFLTRPALASSITVSVNGMQMASGWNFDEESNSIIFDEATVPQADDTIVVDYEARCYERRSGP